MSFNKNNPYNNLLLLFLTANFDDVELLKLINKANNSIFELKGVANILPNKLILLSLLFVKEVVVSSELTPLFFHPKPRLFLPNKFLKPVL